jgi:hypothetical protein
MVFISLFLMSLDGIPTAARYRIGFITNSCSGGDDDGSEERKEEGSTTTAFV